MNLVFIYTLGVCTPCLLSLLWGVVGILYSATRDTAKYWRLPLKPGYRWWTWLWLTPVTWCSLFRDHCKAWWNGYTLEINV